MPINSKGRYYPERLSKDKRDELSRFNDALYGQKENGVIMPATKTKTRKSPARQQKSQEQQSSASGYSNISIIGYLGTDPELRYIPSGVAVADFRIAVNGPNDTVDWFTVSAWENQAEFVNEYLAKGRKVFVNGRFYSETYETSEGEERTALRIRAFAIQFADSPPSGD